MLPPEGVIRATCRWLELLQRSSANQAWALLQANTAFADLPTVAYLQALDWLRTLGFLEQVDTDSRLRPWLLGLSAGQRHQLLYVRGLTHDAPLWLPDADTLVTEPGELPADAVTLARQLGLTDIEALVGITHAHGKVDTERTAEVGLHGEQTLCAALETAWPGSTTHLAALDDGWGYDIAFTPTPDQQWHLEVKTTTRRGRFTAFLSRNEHTVSTGDPAWRVVAVGLDASGELAAVATVKPGVITARAPRDISSNARWHSTRYELQPTDFDRGLSFFSGPLPAQAVDLAAGLDPDHRFAWMPA